jgi:hypothetical protein
VGGSGLGVGFGYLGWGVGDAGSGKFQGVLVFYEITFFWIF